MAKGELDGLIEEMLAESAEADKRRRAKSDLERAAELAAGLGRLTIQTPDGQSKAPGFPGKAPGIPGKAPGIPGKGKFGR